MNIHEILITKTHNKHYLKKYLNFIQKCQQKNQFFPENYTENHHICPKSKDMFPEYKNLKKYKWNSCKLTYRQHIISHLLLYKTFGTQSQLISVFRTCGQNHVKKLNLKTLNTKNIEKLKKDLSEKRKGIFTRGYDENGKANVKDSTRKLISEQKKKFYLDPENRKKQSEYCKGTTGRVSEKYRIAAKNRTEKHTKNISESLKKYYDSLTNIERKRIGTGIFITPFGNFTSLNNVYRKYCLDNKKTFSVHNVKNNKFLNDSVIGKTPIELGFNFIPRGDLSISQYYASLNLVHQPEPNHPLLLELNDYLSQQKVHR